MLVFIHAAESSQSCWMCENIKLCSRINHGHFCLVTKQRQCLINLHLAIGLKKTRPTLSPNQKWDQTQRDSLAHVFPRFASATCVCFEFWLNQWIDYVIGHFPVTWCLCFKTSSSAKPAIWNGFGLHENEPERRTHCHMNGFVQRLVLTRRQKATRKWPIVIGQDHYSIESCS